MKILDELEKLDKEATEGPWVAHHAAVMRDEGSGLEKQLTLQAKRGGGE